MSLIEKHHLSSHNLLKMTLIVAGEVESRSTFYNNCSIAGLHPGPSSVKTSALLCLTAAQLRRV